MKTLDVPLTSVDFETNELTVRLPEDIIKRGFHAGTVKVDLSYVIADEQKGGDE